MPRMIPKQLIIPILKHAANINAPPYANANNSQAADNSAAAANVTAKADAAADVVSKAAAANATANPDAAANVVSKAVDAEASALTNCNVNENDGQEDAVALPAEPTPHSDVEGGLGKDHAPSDDAPNDNSSTAAKLAEPTDNGALPGAGAELSGNTENWENHTSQRNTEAVEKDNPRRSKRLSQRKEGSQVVDSTEAASVPPAPPAWQDLSPPARQDPSRRNPWFSFLRRIHS